MDNALRNASVVPEDVDYINAHGTGTYHNDLMETRAIKEVFGKTAYSVPVSSTKSMIGHTLSASGILESIATVLAIENDFFPPTINHETKDPNCDLDYVPNISRGGKIDIALSNGFAFAGQNTCVVIKKWRKNKQ